MYIIQDNCSFQQNPQLLILLFKLCTRTFVYCMVVVEKRGVHPEVNFSGFSVSTHLVFWDRISHSLGLIDAARLAGWPALGIPLSLPSPNWDYKHVLPRLGFICGSGIELWSFCLCSKHFTDQTVTPAKISSAMSGNTLLGCGGCWQSLHPTTVSQSWYSQWDAEIRPNLRRLSP